MNAFLSYKVSVAIFSSGSSLFYLSVPAVICLDGSVRCVCMYHWLMLNIQRWDVLVSIFQSAAAAATAAQQVDGTLYRRKKGDERSTYTANSTLIKGDLAQDGTGRPSTKGGSNTR